MKDWQIKLMENPLVNKEGFITHYGEDYLSKLEEFTFKHVLEFYTKFSWNEQCEVTLDKVFEGFYDLDIPNNNYHSYVLIPHEGDYYLFENKMGRASYSVYKIDYDSDLYQNINYNDNNDTYSLDGKIEWDKINYVFNIRLKDMKFIYEFFENFLQRPLELKKEHIRGLKIKQLFK